MSRAPRRRATASRIRRHDESLGTGRRKEGRKEGRSDALERKRERRMDDFLSFRRMITPVLLQVMFVVASALAIAAGVALVALPGKHHRSSDVLAGLALIVLGPLVVRLYCELLIVVFRINET